MPRIFLVEDDIDDQELLKDALYTLDPEINLKSFIHGKAFLEEIERTTSEELPKLIVLDYNIPEMNGAEILQVLQENSRYDHIAKVIWSTSDSEKFKSVCISLGAKDYILKPSNMAGMEKLARLFLQYCNPV